MNQLIDVESTLEKLTPEEKFLLIGGFDRWHTNAIERLNIPAVRFSDGPNGVRGTTYFPGVPAACFPNGTNLGATWNKKLMYEAGQLMAIEAKFKGTHVILGPTINIQRSPLGGRGYESFSEDPLLSGELAAALVNGIQSEKIGACIKHYVCNDIEDDRKAININVTERALREIYLLPFQIAVRDSDPKVIMTSYSKVRGEHVSESKYLLIDVLQKEWGWKGAIISDWGGTYSTTEAIQNGLDLEMPGPPIFRTELIASTTKNAKKFSNTSLDDRVRNILDLVNFSITSGIPENASESTENETKETATRLSRYASDGIVLLKNENNVLPLKKNEKIAIIGPNSKNTSISGGGSAALNSYAVTNIYDGIVAKLDYTPDFTVGAYSHKFLPGLGIQLRRDDGSVGYVAKVYLEPPTIENRTLVDEFRLKESYLRMPDYKNDKIKNNLFYVDFEGTFTPETDGVVEFGIMCVGTSQMFLDGKLLIDNKTKQTPGTSFYNQGTEEVKKSIELKKGQTYKVKIEFGSGPTSKIVAATDSLIDGGGGVAFGAAKVIDVEQEILDAVEIAKKNDKVVLVIGLSKEWESENFDRPDMKIPGYTNKLVSEVVKANPNTVVVNQSGTPVEMPWLEEVPCLVQSWFGGNEAGNAIADILFGDINPSGKLPLSFPYKVEDNPAFINFKSNRGEVLYGEDIFVGYRYYETVKRDVAFPFGFGLSYTKFSFEKISSPVIAGGKVRFSVTVKNNGDFDGAEVIQVYLKQTKLTVERPMKELKDFDKVFIKANKAATVEFELDIVRATSFWDSLEEKWVSEIGEYQILVGNSSDNILLTSLFNVEKQHYWLSV